MVAVPAPTPVVTPVAGLIVAIIGFELDQVPPGVASDKVIEVPRQRLVGPVIDGRA